MYGTVALTSRSIDDYGDLLGARVVAELRKLAEPLRGARVLNLNLTAFGTGVADLLSASVPLFNDLGLDCHWQVIRATDEFGHVTKALYAALCGNGNWTSDLSDVWLRYCDMNAKLLDEPFDFVVIHDPQPAGLCAYLESTAASRVQRWVWHCHMDLSHTQPDAWAQVRMQLPCYDAVVFPFDTFLPPGPRPDRLRFITPCIDPLGPRNMDIAGETVSCLLQRQGIDPHRPLVAQISPMDEHTDPLGAIEAYLLAREQVPGLQLALVAAPLSEEHDARLYYERVAERVAGLPDVHLLTGQNEVGNVEINVLQRAAHVIIQRALSRGFGAWLAEAQWKGRPVVAAPHPGAVAQIADGDTGYLAATTEELAGRIVTLLRDRDLAARIGQAGRAAVRRRYLLPRYLADKLRLLNELRAAPASTNGAPHAGREGRQGRLP